MVKLTINRDLPVLRAMQRQGMGCADCRDQKLLTERTAPATKPPQQRTIYRCSAVKRKDGNDLVTTDHHRVRIDVAFLLPADVPLMWPKDDQGYKWLNRDECQKLFMEQGITYE